MRRALYNAFARRRLILALEMAINITRKRASSLMAYPPLSDLSDAQEGLAAGSVARATILDSARTLGFAQSVSSTIIACPHSHPSHRRPPPSRPRQCRPKSHVRLMLPQTSVGAVGNASWTCAVPQTLLRIRMVDWAATLGVLRQGAGSVASAITGILSAPTIGLA